MSAEKQLRRAKIMIIAVVVILFAITIILVQKSFAGPGKNDDLTTVRYVVSLIAFFVTWGITIFGAGVAYGKIKSRLSVTEKEIVKINRKLSDESGDPHFISYPAHDKIQENCQKMINQQLFTIDTNIKDIKDTIDDMRRRDPKKRTRKDDL